MRIFRPLPPASGAQRPESGREFVDQKIAIDKHKFRAG
jgi:hypothetical protein